MWGEVYVPLVDDQCPCNPYFDENCHEQLFSIIRKDNIYKFFTKKWSPPEIQECDLLARKRMWGEMYEPLVDDQWQHNPIFFENSHERSFSIIHKANTYSF
jgi:hypothetical protein